ncbi:MAG: Npt1/Npt2 family nucleotide transporter [Alphaproteobacteria bacterium]
MPAHQNREDFSKIRSWMFPIYSHELIKLIPMGLLMILISFNFWILHISKDTLVITAKHSGAEVISFLKLPVFLFSILFIMGFTWASNLFKQRAIFYGIITFFIVFFLVFKFVLYPYQDSLNMFTSEELFSLKARYPSLRWLFPVLCYWGYSLFYIISELWGAVVLSLLFWQFSNQITTVEQSRRFYMLFGMFNGLGTILLGVFVYYYQPGAGLAGAYAMKLDHLILIFSFVSLLIMGIYFWVNKYAVKDKMHYHPDKGTPDAQHEIKLSFVESFRYILTSKYVGYIAIISIAYNISINFVEVTWKSQIEKMYPDPSQMESYFSLITIYIGILTCAIGFFGAGFIRRFSWKTSALVTPVAMLVAGSLFYWVTLKGESLYWLTQLICMSPVAFSVWIGQIHNLTSRSCKYSFFAATREMAFIPLDAELKVKGKAAVDVLSGRVGKFGASLIQSVLLSLSALSTQTTIAPFLMVASLLVIVVWMWSINRLNKEFLNVAYGSTTAEQLKK